jgi:hypothetical protein
MKEICKALIPIVFLVIISGCSNKEDKLELIFFSDLSSSKLEEIENIVQSAVAIDETEFEVNMYPVTYERLIVEIASHNGDILFLDEELMSAAYDTEGLHPLNEILNEDWISRIPSDYKEAHAETGETYVYALPLDNQSPFLQDLGVKLENPLVAIVPVYTKNKAFSTEVLQYIIKSN